MGRRPDRGDVLGEAANLDAVKFAIGNRGRAVVFYWTAARLCVTKWTGNHLSTFRAGGRVVVFARASRVFRGDSMAAKIEKLEDLRPDSRNANRGTKRGLDLLEKSLLRLGAGRSIVVDRAGNVIAGNKTLEVAAELGLPIEVVETDGKRLVVVRRTDLDLDSKNGRELAVADNRTSEVGLEWDAAEVVALIEEDVVIGEYFADSEIERLVRSLDEEGNEGEEVFSSSEIVEAAFEFYRENGFPYPKLSRFESMQEINRLAKVETAHLRGTTVGYEVADSYHRHRFAAAANGANSPLDSFAIDKWLRRALENAVDGNRSITAGALRSNIGPTSATGCANFRPGFAVWIYRRFCSPGSVVLDSSAGYGGRLVGAIASGVVRKYVGIDPNAKTDAANRRLAEDLAGKMEVDLYKLPAEDFAERKYRKKIDFAFTSPPYYAKEIYSKERTQSCRRYPTGEKWRDGFLFPLLAMQAKVLRPGATNVVNIADVTIKKQSYPLVDWTKEAADAAGFDLVETLYFPLGKRWGERREENRIEAGIYQEPVLVFRKRA